MSEYFALDERVTDDGDELLGELLRRAETLRIMEEVRAELSPYIEEETHSAPTRKAFLTSAPFRGKTRLAWEIWERDLLLWEVAQATGVSSQHLSSLQNGHGVYMSERRWRALIDYFGLSRDELLSPARRER